MKQVSLTEIPIWYRDREKYAPYNLSNPVSARPRPSPQYKSRLPSLDPMNNKNNKPRLSPFNGQATHQHDQQHRLQPHASPFLPARAALTPFVTQNQTASALGFTLNGNFHVPKYHHLGVAPDFRNLQLTASGPVADGLSESSPLSPVFTSETGLTSRLGQWQEQGQGQRWQPQAWQPAWQQQHQHYRPQQGQQQQQQQQPQSWPQQSPGNVLPNTTKVSTGANTGATAAAGFPSTFLSQPYTPTPVPSITNPLPPPRNINFSGFPYFPGFSSSSPDQSPSFNFLQYPNISFQHSTSTSSLQLYDGQDQLRLTDSCLGEDHDRRARDGFSLSSSAAPAAAGSSVSGTDTGVSDLSSGSGAAGRQTATTSPKSTITTTHMPFVMPAAMRITASAHDQFGPNNYNGSNLHPHSFQLACTDQPHSQSNCFKAPQQDQISTEMEMRVEAGQQQSALSGPENYGDASQIPSVVGSDAATKTDILAPNPRPAVSLSLFSFGK